MSSEEALPGKDQMGMLQIGRYAYEEWQTDSDKMINLDATVSWIPKIEEAHRSQNAT